MSKVPRNMPVFPQFTLLWELLLRTMTGSGTELVTTSGPGTRSCQPLAVIKKKKVKDAISNKVLKIQIVLLLHLLMYLLICKKKL